MLPRALRWVVGCHARSLHPLIIEPLPAEDLPGCMSDGETPEEAIANVRDAIATWIEAAHDLGRSIPAPRRHLEIA
jgi:hypothetical protein